MKNNGKKTELKTKEKTERLFRVIAVITNPNLRGNLYQVSLAYADAAHYGVRRKVDTTQKYVEHSIAVARLLDTPEGQSAGLFHDTIEQKVKDDIKKPPNRADKPAFEIYVSKELKIIESELTRIHQYLRRFESRHYIVGAVDLLTRRATMTADEHIMMLIDSARKNMRGGVLRIIDELTLKVKIADLTHNLSDEQNPVKKTADDQRRYDSALRRLEMIQTAFPRDQFPQLYPKDKQNRKRGWQLRKPRRPKNRYVRESEETRKGWGRGDEGPKFRPR